MKFRAVIFDMDGTIVDTEHLWHEATMQLIQRRGIVCDDRLCQELLPQVQGLAIHKSCQIIRDYCGFTDCLDDLMEEKMNLANALYSTGIRYIEGFASFHTQVRAYGLRHGIATNAGDTTIYLTDQALNIREHFGEHIYGISCVGNVCKPDPDIYLYAAEKLGCEPGECIAIEDSAHGVRAAKQAGMYCIGINTAQRPEQIAAADLKIDRYADIKLEDLLGLQVKPT